MRGRLAIVGLALASAAGCAATPRVAESPRLPVPGAAPMYGIVQDRDGRYVLCVRCPGPTPKTPVVALAEAPRTAPARARAHSRARKEETRPGPARLAAARRDRTDSRKARAVKQTDAELPTPFHTVHFAFGKHEVAPRERRELVRLAPEIAGRVLVVGYTDDIGPKAYNDWLARERAVAVARVLAEAGIDPSRIEVRGVGKCCYVAGNETREGRARNRRAELRLIRDVRA